MLHRGVDVYKGKTKGGGWFEGRVGRLRKLSSYLGSCRGVS
jgi:hypothetical protein